MINFNPLKDKVALIAPSSGFRGEDGAFSAQKSYEELAYVKKIFARYGLESVHPADMFDKRDLDYFSADKSSRLAHLKWAMESPEVKIISAIRGGYGCSELVLDGIKIKPSGEKILIGFSDITALHCLFNQRFPSIHGMVNRNFEHTATDVINILKGEEFNYPLAPINQLAMEGGEVSGKTTGGNLAVLASLCGTPVAPRFEGKIVIFEDVGEPGYKVHRMLVQLHNAGLFAKAAAVVFADFINSDHLCEASIEHFTENYLQKIPTYGTSKIGHSHGLPFVLEGDCRIIKYAPGGELGLCVSSPFRMKEE